MNSNSLDSQESFYLGIFLMLIFNKVIQWFGMGGYRTYLGLLIIILVIITIIKFFKNPQNKES